MLVVVTCPGDLSWCFWHQLAVDSVELVSPWHNVEQLWLFCSSLALLIGHWGRSGARKVPDVEAFIKSPNPPMATLWHLEMPRSHREGVMASVAHRRQNQQFSGARCCWGLKSIRPGSGAVFGVRGVPNVSLYLAVSDCRRCDLMSGAAHPKTLWVWVAGGPEG